MNAIRIFDDVFPFPQQYREEALRAEFLSYDFGHCVFHGIATGGPTSKLLDFIRAVDARLQPTLTFFRKSPLNQAEPNDIHTDIDMGDWTALFYLNTRPPKADGTTFWTHKATGAISSVIPHERSIEGLDRDAWIQREHVAGKFNRVLMFDSALFHSRSIFENYGSHDSARLVQVVFGKGELL